ncbi:MAG: alkaline phosphatase family protein [Ardenticatenaceae bacterium]|nr:alkaline phosphatase family protein [Ardenticatenaceae bacterium]
MHTIIIGLDAFDPTTFERLYEHGQLPHLGKYVQAGKYKQLAVANPPQSEVSWTSIATGLDPGGHGLFDFVHRDPRSYSLYVSLLPTQQGLGGTKFVPPFTARTLFDHAVQQGYPATSLWWPATFPTRPESPVHTLPGLGTPDILGRLGVGTHFSTNTDLISEQTGRKIPVQPLMSKGKNDYHGNLKGPIRPRKRGAESMTLPFALEVRDGQSARLSIGSQKIELQVGQWSPIIELSFKVNWLFSIHALTSFILTDLQPAINLYALPLQIHPLHALWPYATPPRFVKKVWHDSGPFYTLGWPQDTTALEEGCINDEQFLNLCEQIFAGREKVLLHQIDQFKEGVLACVFDTLDRVQHMFWRDRPDVVEAWYMKLDALIGRIEQRLKARGLQNKTRLVILSDHGFAPFDYKVHLNRWLLDNGYLVSQLPGEASGNWQQVDWRQTQAYGIGLNSVYLNLAGREGQGCVEVGQKEHVLHELCDKLRQWEGANGRSVIQNVYKTTDIFNGAFTPQAPDIIVGYAPGYRASPQTGLGAWQSQAIEPNRDHWGADHCLDHQAVPGVIFASDGLQNFPHPSYRDIPPLTIDAVPDPGDSSPPPPMGDEDQAVIAERLKGLGYL